MLRRKFGPIRAIFSTVGPLFLKNFPLRGSRLGPFRRTACGGANGAKNFENPTSTFLGCHQKKAYFPTLHCQFSRFYFLACFFSYLFSEFHSKTLARGFFKKSIRARSFVPLFRVPCFQVFLGICSIFNPFHTFSNNFLRICTIFVIICNVLIHVLKNSRPARWKPCSTRTRTRAGAWTSRVASRTTREGRGSGQRGSQL
jgi:hypothetical protein